VPGLRKHNDHAGSRLAIVSAPSDHFPATSIDVPTTPVDANASFRRRATTFPPRISTRRNAPRKHNDRPHFRSDFGKHNDRPGFRLDFGKHNDRPGSDFGKHND
jgi:hypothetical protein